MMWYVTAFDKETRELAEEHPLRGITVEQLRTIFDQPDDEDMIETFPITAAHAQRLGVFLEKPLVLAPNRNYYLQCFSE